MTWVLAVKLAIILIFLILFIRRPTFSWGIGLLTVTTALLLDALIGTFEAQDLQAELGFYYFVIAGALFGGAAIWLIGILLPYVNPNRTYGYVESFRPAARSQRSRKGKRGAKTESSFDRQMIYEVIQQRFGREEVLDLIFDMGIQENEVMTVNQDMNELITNILDYAEINEQTSALSLAVERILTPLPPEYLPRLQKLSAESPPTILRQYLLYNYTLDELEKMADELAVDWEQLDYGGKREKSRSMLQYLYRRNRIEDLINLMQESTVADEVGDDQYLQEVEIEFAGPDADSS